MESIITESNGAELDGSARVSLLNEEAVWNMVQEEVAAASEAIERGKSVLFNFYDQTSAGGSHAVLAYYEGERNAVTVEIPDESVIVFPQEKVSIGGRFPTVLHAVEIAVLVARTSGRKRDHAVSIYPRIKFGNRNDIRKLVVDGSGGKHLATVPLTVNPARTNVIVLHQQIRSNLARAAKIVGAHYQVLQGDAELGADILRHTMLVQPSRTLGLGPTKKTDFWIGTLPHHMVSSNFPLAHPGRIQPLSPIDEIRSAAPLAKIQAINSRGYAFYEFSF